MRRAIELAKEGQGWTRPNPLVGAVLVKNDRIIGEGYHEFYGGPHAEVNAFKNATEDVTGSTLYVTLEPCSHFGKTPPCANLIVDKKIKKVIVGLLDPNPLVAGNGIKLLQDHNIEVISGVLEDDCRKMNEIFLKFITTQRPYVILKSAMTLDGKIASITGDSKWITSQKSRAFVHEIRHHLMAIMTGIDTVLIDNPKLTTRLTDRIGKDPIRIIVDSKARIPLDCAVISNTSKAKTIVATTELADSNKIKALEERGVEVIIIPSKNNRVDLPVLMDELGRRKIDSILLEGGSALNFSALQDGIVDQVYQFISPKIIGGTQAKSPVGGIGIERIDDAIQLTNVTTHIFDDDILVIGYTRKE